MKNSFIKCRISLGNAKKREHVSKFMRKTDLFPSFCTVRSFHRTNPPIKQSIYHTCCDNFRFPTSRRREESSPRCPGTGLWKTVSQMIDLVKWPSSLTYESRHHVWPRFYKVPIRLRIRDTVKFLARRGNPWSQRTSEIAYVHDTCICIYVCDIKYVI